MEKINGNFGFGAMRLPQVDGKVDMEHTARMFDAFLEAGFNYFDTAHGYINGQSEMAIRQCLTSRYPRDRYLLTNKLTGMFFEKEEDIRPLFEEQLKACGVDYFDFYLMHSQDSRSYEKFKKCFAYEVAMQLKEEGKIRHMGISFHDKAAVLDKILTEYPQVEVVQIQLNYLDMDDPMVEARLCYEVCCKHGKPVIVMEPVKGGALARLPEEGKKVFAALGGGSDASYAIRFAASAKNVFMVLSGMSDLDMVKDNVSYMKDFVPLNQEELRAVKLVRDILRDQRTIPCTDCKYCTHVCPMGIAIPQLFSCYNSKKVFNAWTYAYYRRHVNGGADPQDCVGCGACEEICPQHLPIRSLLKDVAAEFAKK